MRSNFLVPVLLSILSLMPLLAQSANPPLNPSDLFLTGTVQSVDLNADCKYLNQEAQALAGAGMFGISGPSGCYSGQTTYVNVVIRIQRSTDSDYHAGDNYNIPVVSAGAVQTLRGASGVPSGTTVSLYNKEAGFCSAQDSHILSNDHGGWICAQ